MHLENKVDHVWQWMAHLHSPEQHQCSFMVCEAPSIEATLAVPSTLAHAGKGRKHGQILDTQDT